MCGIAGVVGLGVKPQGQEITSAMLREIASRGPDHRGLATVSAGDLTAVLGHNRLSIIDLTAAGNQPMSGEAGRLWLTYNGEIYNYLEIKEDLERAGIAFHTRSDSEVLLAAWAHWGMGALDRFNGMFAFALVERDAGTVTLVRDRFGVKPLYYSLKGPSLYFASTPGAVARQVGARPSAAYVARGLSSSLFEDEGELSPFEGVHAVPAGHLVRITRSGAGLATTLVRWYDLEARVAGLREEVRGGSEAALVELTGDLIAGAVRFRLRADVPVGVSLSGGIDSSTVAALAHRAGGRMLGFTFGARDDRESEGPTVAQLAARTGMEVAYIPSSSGSEVLELFDATLAAQDAPFTSASVVAQFSVFRHAKARGITVMLGGQGGDEAFMGYHKFKLFHARELAREGRWIGALSAGLSALRAIGASGLGWSMWRRQFIRYGRPATSGGLFRPLPLSSGRGLALAPGEPAWKRQAFDVTSASLPTLLRYEDRNSMGNSIESRLPFVDYRVVELGLALPTELKIRHGMGKWVLREVTKDLLPPSIRLARGKRGFDAGQEHAIRSGLGAHIRERLHGARDRVQDWLKRPLDPARDFPDRRLASEPIAFLEATSLIWLGTLGGGGAARGGSAEASTRAASAAV